MLPFEQRDQDYRRLRSGEVLVKPIAVGLDVPDGMIHDWIGIVFISGAMIDRVLGILHQRPSAFGNDFRRL